MNAEQKVAWFTLVVCLAAISAAGLLHWHYGFPMAFAGFALLGLTGFNPILLRSASANQAVDCDERDRMILRRATVAGGMVSYLIFVLACMGAWFLHFSTGKQDIDISILPLIVCLGGIGLLTARSLAILILYREGGSYAEG